MKTYYYVMMKYYDHLCGGAFGLEDMIYFGNQYIKYRRLYEGR